MGFMIAVKKYIKEVPENSLCPECASKNQNSFLRFMFLSEEIAVLRCPMINCWYPRSKFIFKELQSQKVYYHQQIPEESHQSDFINNFDCSFFNENKAISENNSSLTETRHLQTCEEDYLFANSSLEIIEKSLINDDFNITDMMDDLLQIDDASIQSSSDTEPLQVFSQYEANEEKQTKTIDFKLIEEKLKQRLFSRSVKYLKQHEQPSFFYNKKSSKRSKLKPCKNNFVNLENK